MCSVLAFVSSPTDDGPDRRVRKSHCSLEGHPDLGKAILPHEQVQHQPGIPPTTLLFPGLGCPNLRRMTHLGTRSPTLPVAPKTTAWFRWLRCPPPPHLPRQSKTLAPYPGQP